MAPTIVVVPGLWSGRAFWQVLLSMARQPHAGWRLLEVPWVFRPVPVRWGFRAEQEALLAQVRDLVESRQPVVLIGHSYGAQHALQMVRDCRLNVSRVVLLAPALGRGWWLRAGMRIVRALLLAPFQRRSGRAATSLVVSPAEFSAALEFRRRALRQTGLQPQLTGMLAQVLAGGGQTLQGHDVGLLAKRQIPGLVVWGLEDGLLPPEMLPPEVSTLLLEKTGHFMFIGQGEVWGRIKAWLDGETGQRNLA